MGSSSSSAPAPHSWVTWLPSEPPHVTPLQAHTLVHCASVHSVQPNSRRAAFTSAQLVMLSLNPSRIWRSAGGERRQRGGKRKDEGSGSCRPAQGDPSRPARRAHRSVAQPGAPRLPARAQAEQPSSQGPGRAAAGLPAAERPPCGSVLSVDACKKAAASPEASYWRQGTPGACTRACTAP